MDYIVNKLNDSVLFKDRTRDEIRNALSSINYIVRYYEKKECVFRIDQSPECVGIILDGSIEIQKNLASGKKIIVFYKNKGDCFGECSTFSKTTTYSCNVFAKVKSEILLISKQDIIHLINNDSILLKNFLDLLANQVLLLNLKTELLSYSAIQQKIAFSLLYLMNECKHANIVILPYSKKVWSEHLNVSRPSLFRELKFLYNQKIINIQNRTITILNEEYLKDLLN